MRAGRTLGLRAALTALLLLLLGLAPTSSSARPDTDATVRKVSDTLRARSVMPGQTVEGLDVEATTTYRLDEAAGVVRVRAEVTLTNTSPPQSTALGTRYFYFDRFAVAALGPTANASASRDGTELAVRLEEPDAHVDFLVVDLSPDLTYGSPQQIVVTYDLPTQPNGSEAVTRVNDAFATWYVSSVGDDGNGDVVIDVPARFDLETVTEASGRTEEGDGRAITTFEDLTQASGFFGVSARDDEALVIRSTTVDDDEYEIQAWPGDEAWADFAVDTVESGIPALSDIVGLDVEDEREITVAESGTPYLYGYGGWYSPADDRVEIGDQQDLHTMLHELAHLWYHSEMFSSRWVTEGLADLAASHAATELGEEPLAVEPLDAAAPGSQPLNRWDDANPGDISDVADVYGYETSYALLSALHNQVGTDALQSVVARADAKELPLSVDGDVVVRRVHDWRYFYDLLATTPDVDVAGIDTLFDAYVWTDADRSAIETRRGTMERYDALVAAGDWAPPVVVRKALANWDFDNAGAAIDVSHLVLEEVVALERILEPTDAELTAVRDAHEEAGSVATLEQLLDDIPDFADAARELADLDARLDGLNPVQRLGLVGRDIDGRQDRAEDAFADGDLDEMDDVVAEIDDVVGQALPTALAIALLPAAWLVFVVGRTRLRRRRRHQQAEIAALEEAFWSGSGELADGVDDQPGEAADATEGV